MEVIKTIFCIKRCEIICSCSAVEFCIDMRGWVASTRSISRDGCYGMFVIFCYFNPFIFYFLYRPAPSFTDKLTKSFTTTHLILKSCILLMIGSWIPTVCTAMAASSVCSTIFFNVVPGCITFTIFFATASWIPVPLATTFISLTFLKLIF